MDSHRVPVHGERPVPRTRQPPQRGAWLHRQLTRDLRNTARILMPALRGTSRRSLSRQLRRTSPARPSEKRSEQVSKRKFARYTAGEMDSTVPSRCTTRSPAARRSETLRTSLWHLPQRLALRPSGRPRLRICGLGARLGDNSAPPTVTPYANEWWIDCRQRYVCRLRRPNRSGTRHNT